ncbi:MAG: hypothetical protein MHPSP_004364, partial [Paramarteilia canceri]
LLEKMGHIPGTTQGKTNTGQVISIKVNKPRSRAGLGTVEKLRGKSKSTTMDCS